MLNDSILSGFNNSDEKAFKAVFDDLYKPLLLFAIKITKDRQQSEDVVLMSMQATFNRHNTFDKYIALKAFLFTSVRNACLNYIRAKERLPFDQYDEEYLNNIKDEERFILEITYRQNLIEELSKAIDKLPKTCRKIMKLSLYEKKTPGQIAEILGIQRQTVYAQQWKALNQFRLYFNQHIKPNK